MPLCISSCKTVSAEVAQEAVCGKHLGQSMSRILSCLAQNMGMKIFRSLLSGSRQSVSKFLKRLINQNSLSVPVAQCSYFNEKTILKLS